MGTRNKTRMLDANYELRSAGVPPEKMTKSALDGRTNAKQPKAATGMKRQQLSTIAKSQTVTIPKPVFKLSGTPKATANPSAKVQSQSSSGQMSHVKVMHDVKTEMDDDMMGGGSSGTTGNKRKREDDEFELVG